MEKKIPLLEKITKESSKKTLKAKAIFKKKAAFKRSVYCVKNLEKIAMNFCKI